MSTLERVAMKFAQLGGASEDGTTSATAKITRKDEYGTAYARVAGGEEFPVAQGVNVHVGDTVGVEFSDGRAVAVVNYSKPPTDDTTAKQAVNYAQVAGAAADEASRLAGVAKDQADAAKASADEAAELLDGVKEVAESVDKTVAEIIANADESYELLDDMQDAAEAAGTTLEGIYQDAADAQAAATQANSHANDALTQLSFVEDVAGTLAWIQEHATFTASADTSVQEGTVYFAYNSTTLDYEPVVSPDEDANPHDLGWFVIDVTTSQRDYIMSHLAVTSRGLWVLPGGKAATDQTVDPSQDAATAQDTQAQKQANANARKGPEYKVLLSNDGMYVYDGSGHLVATYGESITFDSSRPQSIGSESAYLLFHDTDDDDEPDTITLGGNVVLGETRTLSELMEQVDNTLIYDTTYQYNQARTSVTFTAHLYQGGEDIASSYADSCFTWWLKGESWVQGEPMTPLQSNGDRTCTVSLDNAGFGATVVGRFTPPNDAVLLDDDDDVLTDGDGEPLAVRTPSGDYVRVSDLEVSTSVFDTDKLMVVGAEDEHLVSVATLKGVFGTDSYDDLDDRPQIEGVTLTGDKSFPDLGIFKTDSQGYSVADDYTLSTMDINALWAAAVPIGG